MSIKLLKDLNFAETINGTEAVTEAGKQMLNNYRSYLFTNPANCSIVNNFIKEASNFSFDTGLVSILESVAKFISENKISWKLASACESISNNNGAYNYIAKLGVNQVEKLLEMNEAEVVSYIKAGALKSIQYIPEFRNICKEVYKTTIVETHNNLYSVVNPVSYVLCEGKNNEKQYFNINGKTFVIENGKVNEGYCSDVKFNKINSLLESFKGEDGKLIYEYKSAMHDSCKFIISENEIELVKGSNSHKFDTAVKFNEHIDMVSKIMPVYEKMNFLTVAKNIADVFESMDSIVVLDCTKLMTTADGTVCAITEAKDNVNLTVFRSYNAGTSSTNYDFVIEALKNVTKLTGVDLKSMYESRITEDCKKQNPEEVEQLTEQLKESKQAKLDVRKKQIAMLAEKYKNDPARITLLNSAARDLALLEENI